MYIKYTNVSKQQARNSNVNVSVCCWNSHTLMYITCSCTDNFSPPFSVHSMRFPDCFVAADEARELQRTIEKEIASYLGKRLRPVSNSPKVYT